MTAAPTCNRCQHRHLRTLPCWSGRYVAQLRALVLSTYGDTCCHCGVAHARSVEHVQPRSAGGTDALTNLRPAHLACNIARGTRPMPGWGLDPIAVEVSPRW
jgi:hypothetical protein